jgi:hypothetical protein
MSCAFQYNDHHPQAYECISGIVWAQCCLFAACVELACFQYNDHHPQAYECISGIVWAQCCLFAACVELACECSKLS